MGRKQYRSAFRPEFGQQLSKLTYVHRIEGCEGLVDGDELGLVENRCNKLHLLLKTF
jgi:hypothetical protein